jgi:hypothetical protein
MCTRVGGGQKVEVLGISNLEYLIAPFSHITCFTHHRLWRWQLFPWPARMLFHHLMILPVEYQLSISPC